MQKKHVTKIQYMLVIKKKNKQKTSQQTGTEGTFINLIKGIYEKHILKNKEKKKKQRKKEKHIFNNLCKPIVNTNT